MKNNYVTFIVQCLALWYFQGHAFNNKSKSLVLDSLLPSCSTLSFRHNFSVTSFKALASFQWSTDVFSTDKQLQPRKFIVVAHKCKFLSTMDFTSPKYPSRPHSSETHLLSFSPPAFVSFLFSSRLLHPPFFDSPLLSLTFVLICLSCNFFFSILFSKTLFIGTIAHIDVKGIRKVEEWRKKEAEGNVGEKTGK